jgi:hypothetical protein
VEEGGYGLVLIASWQAVVRGLIRDENDNAGAVRVVEDVKAATRATGIPWLVDAHAGKSEDQGDDADPSRAMRGASAAAGAADYTLHLRYANGAFGTQRKLSGKGRFVNVVTTTFDYDPATGSHTLLGDAKNAARETNWRLITETGALTAEARSEREIALAAGFIDASGEVTTTHRRQVRAALADRAEVDIVEDVRARAEDALVPASGRCAVTAPCLVRVKAAHGLRPSVLHCATVPPLPIRASAWRSGPYVGGQGRRGTLPSLPRCAAHGGGAVRGEATSSDQPRSAPRRWRHRRSQRDCRVRRAMLTTPRRAARGNPVPPPCIRRDIRRNGITKAIWCLPLTRPRTAPRDVGRFLERDLPPLLDAGTALLLRAALVSLTPCCEGTR